MPLPVNGVKLDVWARLQMVRSLVKRNHNLALPFLRLVLLGYLVTANIAFLEVHR